MVSFYHQLHCLHHKMLYFCRIRDHVCRSGSFLEETNQGIQYNSLFTVMGSVQHSYKELVLWMMSLLQIAFLCLIYPVLLICYAGQAAYISKNLNVQDFNHLTESVPGKLFTLLLLFICLFYG